MKLAHNVKISEHNILNTTYSILTSFCNFHLSSRVLFYLSKILCSAKKHIQYSRVWNNK